ncbi:MAG TPA: peptidylprolyl isomerase [Candidatus Thorarchaeota archaeon]|nr:MAG: peptidylprolyl isomerase [Candidatus Thorarchaeota archaeon]RLI61896.1 MAG: peptidylprolyl isomerase [Candidatus Thorarchaeota archaeon]HDD67490.1 peptidylprolyl isomerase [Candidatus Thorarchaeota archaeon]
MATKVRMETEKGTIMLELWSDDAVNTVKNFVELARSGFYDGLTFHRVVDNFVVQGGDPLGNGTGGPGYAIPCETSGSRQKHVNGALSMAHAGRDTGGSQFFIVLNEKNCRHLDGRHTVFGQVTEGFDVVQRIRQGDKMLKVEVLEVDPVIEQHELIKLPARR